MRNFWTALISVLTITLFAGTTFATAPVVQDVPDFRLLTGSDSVVDFDLDDYVTDFDDDPADLSWTIQSQTGFTVDPGSLGTAPDTNLLDIAGSASVDTGSIVLRATDPGTEYSEDSTVVKYSSLLLVGPSLTQDNNLAPQDTVPRTVVIQEDRDVEVSVADIKALISPGSAASDPNLELYVSIADLAGDILDGNNTDSASYGALSASLATTSGMLTLAAPVVSGGAQLTEAYRVGIKAKLTGGAGANWDGMELLVSPGRFPESRDGVNTTRLDQFGNFEGAGVLGALPIGQSAMRALADANNPRWYSSGTATFEIVSGAPSATWASSGQCLKVTMASGQGGMVLSEWFTDIAPGETVTLAANIMSPETTGAPLTALFMGNFHTGSNYEGVFLQQGAGTGYDEAPMNGAWRTVKATFTADSVGADVDDGGTPINFYQRGYQAALAVGGHATSTYPLEVYVDNVRVYQDATDIDKALGSTAIVPANFKAAPTYADALFDGTFESTATGALGGVQGDWQQLANDGVSTIDSNSANNAPTHEGTNSLKSGIPTSTGTRTAGLAEYVYYEMRADASMGTAGGVDNSGPGIYAMTCYMKTDAPDIKSTPDVMLGLGDKNFKNIPFSSCGLAGAPLDGEGWKEIHVSSAFLKGGNFTLFSAVIAPLVWTTDAALRSYWGSYGDPGLNLNPGYEADANIYIDDIQIHKYQDSSMYFDRSVFPATD